MAKFLATVPTHRQCCTEQKQLCVWSSWHLVHWLYSSIDDKSVAFMCWMESHAESTRGIWILTPFANAHFGAPISMPIGSDSFTEPRNNGCHGPKNFICYRRTSLTANIRNKENRDMKFFISLRDLSYFQVPLLQDVTVRICYWTYFCVSDRIFYTESVLKRMKKKTVFWIFELFCNILTRIKDV